MRIAKTNYGDIIYGEVTRIKPGSGLASDSLTIITLAEVNSRGFQTGKEIKVLFWNSKKHEWDRLSDRARQLNIGAIITARVQFDVGDENKAVGYELKRQGIYKLSDKEIVICGKIAKTICTDKFFGLYIPLNKADENGCFYTEWYIVPFFKEIAKTQSKFLGKGDYVFIKGVKKEKEQNGKLSVQLFPSFIKNISK